ncbi:MAG: hypothetical protein GF311_07650 [Candidatus Lokiarchaeota archaeon]|nr:hypothetical protein [Candidatus Lokiarchaeota archaeon]
MKKRNTYISLIIITLVLLGSIVGLVLFFFQPKSWLENPDFNSSENWFFEIQGDSSDVEGTIENGNARLSILGDGGAQTFFENGVGWLNVSNEEGMTQPDDFRSDDDGWWASHTWDDFEPQLLKIQWEKNFTMDVNMSDYEITQASFETLINATVVAEDANGGGLDCINDTSEILDMGNGDYIRFFVKISDPKKNREFELTSFQTKELGCDSGPITELNDTILIPLNEETLKFYLEEVLKFNSRNFTMVIGFLLWCEDNYNPQDRDHFTDIYMKNLTLSIKYEKNINQFTKINIVQIGDEIVGNNIRISGARLKIDYRMDKPDLMGSKLSELLVKINDKTFLQESKRLTDITSSYQTLEFDEEDVKNYLQINEPIIIAIELNLREDFQLEQPTTIFIDNVYLYIDIEDLSQNWGPLIITMSFMMLSLIGAFVSYNLYFKYSPIQRKLRKIRKKIKKNKKIKKINSIHNRLKIGQSKYSKRIDILNLEEESNINKIKENFRTKKPRVIIFTIIIILFGPFSLIIDDNIFETNYVNDTQINLSSEIITQQWLNNNNFSSQDSWFESYGLIGENNTLTTTIRNGNADFYVLGEKEDFIVCLGIPNNTETSNGWYTTTNSRIVVKPTLGYEINESGCYASHKWEEHGGDPFEVNARQNAAIQWDKNVYIPEDMSKYVITNASFKVKVNATVRASPGEWSSTGNGGGLEISADESGDSDAFDIGDFVTFYAILSTPEKNIQYTVAEYIPRGLGNDTAGLWDSISDTVFEPEKMEDFIFYLTQVLKSDNHNFTLTLGMEFYCEDDESTDEDYFKDIYIKECNFSFTYQKLIPKYSSISLNQITDKIPAGNVEILDGKINLKYFMNGSWPEDLSQFSEMRISINNNTLPKTILLKDFNSTIQTLQFNAKSYIVKNKTIYFTIEIFMGNTFRYDQNITLSIQQVDLLISYRYIESSSNLLPLAVGLGIGFMGLLIGIGAYQLYFKYPPTVRKIRKLKKKIRKNKKVKALQISERKSSVSLISSKKKRVIPSESEESVQDKSFNK